MNLEKVSLTLYEFLGYLLPGFLLVFACSLIEATFLNTSALSLSNISGNLVASSIAAYFLGHASHRLGSVLKERRRSWFSDTKRRLNPLLYERVCEALKLAYRIELPIDTSLSTLDTYILADNYITASEEWSEREVLMAREGFFKASMVGFGIVTVVFFVAMAFGGVRLQSVAGDYIELDPVATGVLAGIALFLTVLFRSGFLFYNRLKVNNTLITFLALFEKGAAKGERSK